MDNVDKVIERLGNARELLRCERERQDNGDTINIIRAIELINDAIDLLIPF